VLTPSSGDNLSRQNAVLADFAIGNNHFKTAPRLWLRKANWEFYPSRNREDKELPVQPEQSGHIIGAMQA
jgi:hypothetical protein